MSGKMRNKNHSMPKTCKCSAVEWVWTCKRREHTLLTKSIYLSEGVGSDHGDFNPLSASSLNKWQIYISH